MADFILPPGASRRILVAEARELGIYEDEFDSHTMLYVEYPDGSIQIRRGKKYDFELVKTVTPQSDQSRSTSPNQL